MFKHIVLRNAAQQRLVEARKVARDAEVRRARAWRDKQLKANLATKLSTPKSLGQDNKSKGILKEWKRLGFTVLPVFTFEDIMDFQFVKRLGKGSHGTASLVECDETNFVLKLAAMDEDVDNYELEAKLHMIAGGAGGTPVLVGLCRKPLALLMSFVGHQNLGEYISQNPPDTRALYNILSSVAYELQKLNEKKIIHNDLKPDNILIQDMGNGFKINIIDLGLSGISGRHLSVDPKDEKTYPWMCPLLFRGGTCSPATDLYSFIYFVESCMDSVIADSTVKEAVVRLVADTKRRIVDNENCPDYPSVLADLKEILKA
ncbi:U-box domain-containing protein 35-like [Homarus americanus]|uniref:U-box domain-containing protein 35-like n=1 Tax=Homarus americanus TaxID=6706 RepID=UPI001C45C618|nr:U-box domain-containing protein 35-like [Homarus americanus]